MPPTRKAPRAVCDADRVLLRKRVGRHDGARARRLRRCRAERGRGRARSRREPVHLELDADDAGDATSTCSGAQPTRARRSRRPFAGRRSSPCAPVQALAQPLLTTMARACRWRRSRCSRDTSTGAAWARLVVKTPRPTQAHPPPSQAEIQALAAALMPQCTPAA